MASVFLMRVSGTPVALVSVPAESTGRLAGRTTLKGRAADLVPPALGTDLAKRPHGEMEIIGACEASVPGSSPGGVMRA